MEVCCACMERAFRATQHTCQGWASGYFWLSVCLSVCLCVVVVVGDNLGFEGVYLTTSVLKGAI